MKTTTTLFKLQVRQVADGTWSDLATLPTHDDVVARLKATQAAAPCATFRAIQVTIIHEEIRDL